MRALRMLSMWEPECAVRALLSPPSARSIRSTRAAALETESERGERAEGVAGSRLAPAPFLFSAALVGCTGVSGL
eukprot:scaffold100980_cov19-Tisochrysis_lutea.AAC.1